MNLGAREKTPPWQNCKRKTRHDCLTNARKEDSLLLPFVEACNRFIVRMPFEHLRVCDGSSTFVQNALCVCVLFLFFYCDVIDEWDQEGGRHTFSPSCHMVGVWVEKFARAKLGMICRGAKHNCQRWTIPRKCVPYINIYPSALTSKIWMHYQ